MPPTPEADVVVDIAALRDASHDAGRPVLAIRDSFSWDLDGDVLRDLLLRAG
jgi:hypothetical protein